MIGINIEMGYIHLGKFLLQTKPISIIIIIQRALRKANGSP